MKTLIKDLIIILIVSILLIIIIMFTSEFSTPTFSELKMKDAEKNEVINSIIETEYGLAVDSFEIIKGIIKKNQNLSDILSKHGVSYLLIDKLAKKSLPIFDVRKIKSGNKYMLFFNNDSVKSLSHFIYEENRVSYIKYSLTDSITVKREKKDITIVKKMASGTIESSLWNAMKESNANPMLAVELSEIYAWTIDFFGIQKGDKFKVLYEEEFVDSASIGISKIHAVCFTHYGKDFWAYEFMQDSTLSYYDENGNSLRKAFLKAPLRFSRISSRFSNSRLHPVLKIRRPHHGIDYAAATGTPVHSIGDGVVIKKGYQKRGGGRYVKIKHNSVYTTTYMHFSKFAKGIKVGTVVSQGQTIGYVGQSGLATGPHLDFRVYKNGTAINPLKLESPPVKPISDSNKDKFNIVVENWNNQIAQ